MKKRILLMGVAAVALGLLAQAGSTVEPETLGGSWTRGDADGTALSTRNFYQGASLLLTNCYVYSSTNTTTRQGLDDVDVEVRVGSTDTNLAYAATVSSTNGAFHCTVVVPALASATVQVKLTDAQTNIYIYPPKTIYTIAPLE